MDSYGRSRHIRLQRLLLDLPKPSAAADEPVMKKHKQSPDLDATTGEDELDAIKKCWEALQSGGDVATGDIAAESDRLWEAWLVKVVKFALKQEDF